MIFKKEGDAWAFKGTMDDGYNQKTANKINQNAFVKTQLFDTATQMNDGVQMKPRATKHQSYINCTQPFKTDDSGNILILSTSDVNGNICYWDC